MARESRWLYNISWYCIKAWGVLYLCSCPLVQKGKLIARSYTVYVGMLAG
jgi:hypothetical protein